MGAAAWLVVATALGLLIGRMIRERDRQVPPPADAQAPTADRPSPPVEGRGRQRRR